MQVNWLMVSILMFGMISLFGFFITKKEGFGKFNISSLLLIMIITISSLLYLNDKMEEKTIINIFFAIIGFAGGLFTSKEN